jgi:hypothetical protein
MRLACFILLQPSLAMRGSPLGLRASGASTSGPSLRSLTLDAVLPDAPGELASVLSRLILYNDGLMEARSHPSQRLRRRQGLNGTEH